MHNIENASKVQQRDGLIVRHIKSVSPVLVTGFGLVVVLGGLTGLNPLIGIVTSLMVLVMALVGSRPVLIAYGLTLAMPLVGGMARGAIIPYLRVGQALLVLGFILFLLARPSYQGKDRLTAVDLAFMLFLLTEAVFPVLALYYRGETLNTAQNFQGVSAFQVLLGPVQYYLLYRIVVATVSSEKQIRMVLQLIFIASILVSLIGIMEKLNIVPVKTFLETYYPIPTPSQNYNIGYDIIDIHQRIASTLEHFSGLGAYLAFVIILALACIAQRQLKISPQLLIVTILLDSITLILTGTFAAWIGLVIGMAIIFWLSGRVPKSAIFVLIGIGLAILIFLPFISARLDAQFGAGKTQGLIPESYAFRIKLWTELFFPAIGQHLWFGAGPTPKATTIWPSEESQYILLLIRGGLAYFFSYVLLIAVAIASCWRQIKSKSKDAIRPVAIATLTILVVINVMNVSGEYFTYAGGTQIIWTLLAIVIANGQFKTLEAANAAKRTFIGEWKLANHTLPNLRSLVATTVEGVAPREYELLSSYSLIPSYVGPQVSHLDRPQQRFAWWGRLLDLHFVKDSVVVGAGSTIARVLGLLFSTLLAHFLLPNTFGFFRYSTTLAGIITIASAASPIGVARFIAAHPNDPYARDRYFSNGLLGITLLLGASLLISLPILWLLHAFNVGTLICIIGLTGFFSYFAVVRGLNNAWKMGFSYILTNVILIIALFALIGFFKLRTATIALTIFGLANLSPFALELFKSVEVRFRANLISKAALLELARFTLPIVTASGAYTIWSGIDLLLVGYFNPQVLGSYAAAKTLLQAFIFVPTAMAMVLMPRVAAMGLDKGKRYSVGAALVAFLISLSGFIIVYAWGHKLIALTFGQGYQDAYLPLVVQGIGMSIYSIYIVLEGFLIGSGQPKLATQALVVALVSTGAIGLWLTPRLGPLGASVSFTTGAILCSIIVLFNTWRFLRKEKQIGKSESPRTSQTSDALSPILRVTSGDLN